MLNLSIYISHLIIHFFACAVVLQDYSFVRNFFLEPRTSVTPTRANMSTELDVIVVGGGISGFAAAITLSRAGHNVRVSP